MISAFRVLSPVFSTPRAVDENVHLRPELPRQLKVFNKADHVLNGVWKLQVKTATKARLIYATKSPAQAQNAAHEVCDENPERREQGVRRMMAKRSSIEAHLGDSIINVEHGGLILNRDADLIHFALEYQNSPEGSEKKTKAWQEYQNILQQRSYIDCRMDLVGEFIFGTTEKASTVMKAVRPSEQPCVDDWNLYETMVEIYEEKCGPLSPHACMHSISLVNMSNAGVKPEILAKAFDYAHSILGEAP